MQYDAVKATFLIRSDTSIDPTAVSFTSGQSRRIELAGSLGTEQVVGEQPVGVTKLQFRCQADSYTRTVKAKDRVSWRGRVWEVVSSVPLTSSVRKIHFVCLAVE